MKFLKDLVNFNEPTSGMFIWMKVRDIGDTTKLIYEKALNQEVLLLPGSAFFVNQNDPNPFVRVSYSLCTPEQIEIVRTIKMTSDVSNQLNSFISRE